MRHTHAARHECFGVWLLVVAMAAMTAGQVSADTPLPNGLTALNQPLPAFDLPNANGPAEAVVHSADLQGKVTIVRFWATW